MLILNSDNEEAALFKVHEAYFSHQSKTMNEA